MEEAEKILGEMPKHYPKYLARMALLAACWKHKDVERAKRVVELLQSSSDDDDDEKMNASVYVHFWKTRMHTPDFLEKKKGLGEK